MKHLIPILVLLASCETKPSIESKHVEVGVEMALTFYGEANCTPLGSVALCSSRGTLAICFDSKFNGRPGCLELVERGALRSPYPVPIVVSIPHVVVVPCLEKP